VRRGVLLAGLLWTSACGPIATAGPGCRPTLSSIALPDILNESSGVAVSLRHPGTFWTHNDAESVLYAVDREGAVTASFPLANRLRDWEDIAVSTCPAHGSCLYLADLGDNYEERGAGRIRLHRLEEPDPAGPSGPAGTDGALLSEVFPIRLPGGPRDIEALLVLPGERVYVVTKGRNHPVTVYRYPPPLRTDTVTLEEVQRLTSRARVFPRQVTGGAVDPRGAVIALRTYESLQFYRMVDDTLAAIDGGLVNLRTLQEGQGEGVGIGLDGLVALTSEGALMGGPGSMSLMRCNLERF
jgi:hypothetical protein